MCKLLNNLQVGLFHAKASPDLWLTSKECDCYLIITAFNVLLFKAHSLRWILCTFIWIFPKTFFLWTKSHLSRRRKIDKLEGNLKFCRIVTLHVKFDTETITESKMVLFIQQTTITIINLPIAPCLLRPSSLQLPAKPIVCCPRRWEHKIRRRHRHWHSSHSGLSKLCYKDNSSNSTRIVFFGSRCNSLINSINYFIWMAMSPYSSQSMKIFVALQCIGRI